MYVSRVLGQHESVSGNRRVIDRSAALSRPSESQPLHVAQDHQVLLQVEHVYRQAQARRGKVKIYGYSSSQSNLPHRCGNSRAI